MSRFPSAIPFSVLALAALPFSAKAADLAQPPRQSPLVPTLSQIKHVGLSDDDSVWIGFGGEVRERYEYWNNFATGRAEGDFLLSRVRASADLYVGDSLRFFAEGKAAFCEGRNLPGGERRIQEMDELDLLQGYAELTLPKTGEVNSSVKAGRLGLCFGKQRLVSPLPWSNTMRAWDGVNATLKTGGWQADAFFTQFAPVRKYEFNNSDRQTLFYGLYATGPIEGELLKADAYYLGRDQSDKTNAYNGTVGQEQRHTAGARLFGKHKASGLDYDLEVAQQFGHVGAGNIDAKMFAAELGWNAGDAAKTRLCIGVDHTTGDHNRGGDVQTFSTLYPLGHAFNGQADIVGRQNLTDFYLGASAKPHRDVVVTFEAHQFWRSDNADGLYNIAGGAANAPATLTRSRDIGTELDLKGNWKIDTYLTLEAGYSHFFCGDVYATGNKNLGNDVDFFYSQLTFAF